MTVTLEPDQKRLVDGVRGSMGKGNRWVLMQGATGSGKTYMGAEIIHGTLRKGTRSMLTVPRKELLKQTAAALREFDIPFSYVADGYDTNPMAKTFLATTQTLQKRVAAGTAPEVDLLMPDETHWGGHGLDQVIQHYKAAGARGIGMSATPWFLNGSGLDCWYDDMVCGESIAWLIEAGRLSDYRMFAPNTPDLSKMRTNKDGDFTKDELNSLVRANGKLLGDAVKHYRDHAMGKLAIAYCTSVEHSEVTALRFNEAGIPAASIDGRKTDEERTRIIQAFARREILVLCNCELLTFGFDLSSASGMDVTVEAMLDLRPTMSLALQMQKWGRVLRRKDFPALIFDHAGNVNRHGFPDDPRDWSLQGTRKKNLKFQAAGVSVKNCTGGFANRDLTGEKMDPCYFSHRPQPRCPNCGAWYDTSGGSIIQTMKGELSEHDRPARREFTEEETLKLREAIDEMTKRGREKGMPASRARSWAISKATASLEEKIDRQEQGGLQVSLVAGTMELPL